MAREDSIGDLTPRQALPASPGFWTRIQAFDGRLSIAKGFTAVTLLTGFFGGYFQYLNSYEEKVSTLAKADMQSRRPPSSRFPTRLPKRRCCSS
jgi:hypothetical protein